MGVLPVEVCSNLHSVEIELSSSGLVGLRKKWLRREEIFFEPRHRFRSFKRGGENEGTTFAFISSNCQDRRWQFIWPRREDLLPFAYTRGERKRIR